MRCAEYKRRTEIHIPAWPELGPYSRRRPASAQRVNEAFTLADYRARYAQYKSDPDLQAAHLAGPWVVMWDDLEVANDYTRDSDKRRDAGFSARRAAAYRTFYEHMPLRLARRRPAVLMS